MTALPYVRDWDATLKPTDRAMTTTIQFGHWGITVASKFFAYPVGVCGPIESAAVKAEAMTYYKSN
jgi:hypothetical protein